MITYQGDLNPICKQGKGVSGEAFFPVRKKNLINLKESKRRGEGACTGPVFSVHHFILTGWPSQHSPPPPPFPPPHPLSHPFAILGKESLQVTIQQSFSGSFSLNIFLFF